MWWPWSKNRSRLRISVAYLRKEQKCLVTVIGRRGLCGDDSEDLLIGKTLKRLRNHKHWKRLEVDFCDLRPVGGHIFASEFMAMLIRFCSIAHRRGVEWKFIFKNQRDVHFLKLFMLEKFFQGHVQFLDDTPAESYHCNPVTVPITFTPHSESAPVP